MQNVKVGTRNLLLGTNQGTNGWSTVVQSGNMGFQQTTAFGTNNAVKFVNAGTSGYSTVIFRKINRRLLEPGKVYTLEFDAVSNISKYIIMKLMDYNGINGNVEFNILNLTPNVPIHYSSTVTLGTTPIVNQDIYFQNVDSIMELTIANMMLVEGNRCGSWLPAPEDYMKTE